MTENPIEIWLLSDARLKQHIERISSSGMSEFDQAKTAFYELSDFYGLKKFPEDITEEEYENYLEAEGSDPRSVFEEVGIVRYLDSSEDPRGIVMVAIYNILNRDPLDIDNCAEMHFGKAIPKSYVIYFTGQDADSTLNFRKDGESWHKEGIKYASKIVR
jgi:hypothetical protein